MFVIDAVSDADGTTVFRVQHYATGDPNPTPTMHKFGRYVDAYNDALMRAAKQSVMIGRPEKVESRLPTRTRTWTVSVVAMDGEGGTR